MLPNAVRATAMSPMVIRIMLALALSGCGGRVQPEDAAPTELPWGTLGGPCQSNSDCATSHWRDCRALPRSEFGVCVAFCVSPDHPERNAELATVCAEIGGQCQPDGECERR